MTVPAEQLLISSIIRNQNLPEAIKLGLNSKMFHIFSNEYLWIEEYYLKWSRSPEGASFKAKFPKFAIKVADNTEHYIDEVRKQHLLYEIDKAINGIVNWSDKSDPYSALDLMSKSVIDITNQVGRIVDGDIFKENEDIIMELARRKERYELTGTSGVPTGFETFDERTGGYGPGELHITAARTGVGKSWTMQKCACHAALAGYRVLYYALEQPRANVMARVASLVSPRIGGRLFTARNLIQGRDYDGREFSTFIEQLKHDVKGQLNVIDGSSGVINTANIAAGIERHKPDIVFIDHITLMGRRSNDHAGVAEVADEITYFSNRYELSIVAGAQLNRQGAQKGAGTDTIAEADKIGQNASGITIVESPSSRVGFYRQIKLRNGSDGWSWWTKFDPDNGEFREISYELAQELIQDDKLNEDGDE